MTPRAIVFACISDTIREALLSSEGTRTFVPMASALVSDFQTVQMSVQRGVHAQIVFPLKFGTYCLAVTQLRIVRNAIVHDVEQRGTTYLNVELLPIGISVVILLNFFAASEISDFRQRQQRI